MKTFIFFSLLALLSRGCQAFRQADGNNKLVVGLKKDSVGSEAERKVTEASKSGKMGHRSVLIPVAEGTEDIEAITSCDVLRRADFEVVLASVTPVDEDGFVLFAKKARLKPDAKIEDVKDKKYDAIVLPGGSAGAKHLRDSTVLTTMLKTQKEAGRLIAAICASPKVVLEEQGLLGDEPATGYPGVTPTNLKEGNVVKSSNGKIITSRGPGTAMQFALAVVQELKGDDAYSKLKNELLFQEP